VNSTQQAIERRDIGIDRASSHAERVSPDWNATADAALRYYLAIIHGRSFLAEEFVAWARVRPNLDMPPDGRAWGSVVRRAALAKRIEKVGYAPANTSNRSPKCLWREKRECL
jgi:hypothetical protein